MMYQMVLDWSVQCSINAKLSFLANVEIQLRNFQSMHGILKQVLEEKMHLSSKTTMQWTQSDILSIQF